ncbi:MAG: SDR family NAD(P)-dependent oxidoreductase [Candidatus Thorarchaeota archaeon]
MNLELKGKHVVITGASGGIGLELTRQLLSEGAQITACYNTQLRELDALSKAAPDRLQCIRADVSYENEVKALFEAANSKFDRVDIAVANAGIAPLQGLGVHEMGLEQWESTIRVNLTGAFLTAKYFFRNLEKYPESNASLILVGSTAGLFGEAWHCDYSTSKAGMHGLLMSLKNEIVHLAERGRVNLVNPGWTLTSMAVDIASDPIGMSRVLQTIPMRKIARPHDIASAILYLASDAVSGHVSGQTLTVAGGMEGRVLFTPDEVADQAEQYRL